MLKYYEGTVFNAQTQTMVNTVNCTGVMGAGIALEFAMRYPQLLEDYKQKCEKKEIMVGKVDYFNAGDRLIINFPTKWHFKYPSKLEWIEKGLKSFVQTYKQYGIESVAFPKLGTLNGGLAWEDVRQLMEKYLTDLDIEVIICLDQKKEAEGLEYQMLNVLNNIDFIKTKKDFKLKEKQIEILTKSKPFTRFWKLQQVESIGITTYERIYKYCYNKVLGVNQEREQLSFL